MRTPLTIFATYWNEKDWIEASLAQIDSLDPQEVFIVDGCFDTRYENKSIDGTRQTIEAWVADRPHAHMISAMRVSKLQGIWFMFAHGLTWWNWPLRIALAAYYSRTNPYRINQACTFTSLLRTAKANKPGDWIMHNDADQFYPDQMIEDIKKIVSDTESQTELLTANEQTFFTDFGHLTTEYDSRNYNNMPYRIKNNTIIVPTRDVACEQYPKPKVYGKNPAIKKQHLGSYFHYKFRPHDKQRSELGNTLGDRTHIETNAYKQMPFTGVHPTVVQSHYNELL